MVIENVNGTELRFKNPGRLLLVVIGFLFWGVGFLDLLGHVSAEPDIFGLYSLPFFIFILLYGSLMVVWLALFINAALLSRIVDGIHYVQSRTWLVLVLLAGLGFALWVIFEWDRWARLPGLQFSIFGLVVLAVGILLFSGWSEKKDQQVWRKVIAYPLFALFAVELVVQAAAWLGVLPGSYRIGGDFYPYERVYYSEGEGLRNDFANRYGWYYPDAKMDENKQRIVLIGGSYVQALQVQAEEQASVFLSELINKDQTDPAGQKEVISIGVPGFGLSPFLYEEYMNELPGLLKTDEIIVFYHLGDDFQSPVSSHTAIRYEVDEANDLIVLPDDARLRHDVTHYYLRAYMSFQLVETIRSNYLTPKVIMSLVQTGGDRDGSTVDPVTDEGDDFPRQVGFVLDTYAVTEPGHAGIKATDLEIVPDGNNFMFLQGGEQDRQNAIAIADSMLSNAQEMARAQGVTLRVVTVPMFPDAFFSEHQGGAWDPRIGKYDLFLPEKALTEIAAKYDIPILPMGQYMLEDGLSVEEIKSLYQQNDRGSFTSIGNEYFAKAIFLAFFQEQK